MNSLRTAFAQFWGGSFYNRSALLPAPILIPAYQDGYAVDMRGGRPEEPPFPYITYQLARPAFADFTIVTGKIWDKAPQSPASFALVDDVLTQAAELIPEGGFILDIADSGALALHRSNPFTQYLPTDDQTLAAGLISVIVRSYVL